MTLSALIVALAGYLGGDFLGLLLARLGVAGFGRAASAAASTAARKAASSLARLALERLVQRAGRDVPEAEREQHAQDAAVVKAVAKDWFA